MNRQAADQVFGACERVLAALATLEQALHAIEDEEERRELTQSLSFVSAGVLGTIRGPVVRQFPDLLPMDGADEPDDVPSADECGVVSALESSNLMLVDGALLAECDSHWKKSARVVAGAMKALEKRFPELPVALYAKRIAMLVDSGRLQSQGDLSHLRFSEVKLAGIAVEGDLGSSSSSTYRTTD